MPQGSPQAEATFSRPYLLTTPQHLKTSNTLKPEVSFGFHGNQQPCTSLWRPKASSHILLERGHLLWVLSRDESTCLNSEVHTIAWFSYKDNPRGKVPPCSPSSSQFIPYTDARVGFPAWVLLRSLNSHRSCLVGWEPLQISNQSGFLGFVPIPNHHHLSSQCISQVNYPLLLTILDSEMQIKINPYFPRKRTEIWRAVEMHAIFFLSTLKFISPL